MLKTRRSHTRLHGLTLTLTAIVALSTGGRAAAEVPVAPTGNQNTATPGTTKGAKPSPAQSNSTRALISSRGCESATAGTGNKIITYQGKTHVAWLDSNENGYFAVVRTLDRKTGTWSQTHTIGKSHDNHGRPAMTIDRQGYLHVVYGLHHNAIPYRRSLRPNDASAWTEPIVFGNKLSYPTLMCGADGALYLTGRYEWSGVRLSVAPLVPPTA